MIIWDAVHRCFPVAMTNANHTKYFCAGTKEGVRARGRRIRTFVHALLALCCVMSTVPPIGQLVGVLKYLIKLTFILGPIRLGPKTRVFWTLKSGLAKEMHLTNKYSKNS